VRFFFNTFVFFLSLTIFACAHAYEKQFVITDILSDNVIRIKRIDTDISILSGDVLIIHSHESKEVLGYARVEVFLDSVDIFTATVKTHNKSGLIRPQNYLNKIDLTREDSNVPARFDLSYNESRKVAAQYKPMVYMGFAQGFTAANLYKYEMLAGPSILGYGLSNSQQVNTNLISTMYKIPNISLKSLLLSNDDFDISIENGIQYYYENQRASYQFVGYLDSNSNSKLKSLFKLRMFTQKPQDEYLYNSEEYNKSLNIELLLSYSYLFDNWNRLIFGPKIDVNKKKVGGIVGYNIIQRQFHTMVGVSSSDFSEFRVGKEGYLFNLDFWWRF
jgi:hypothetical protein